MNTCQAYKEKHEYMSCTTASHYFSVKASLVAPRLPVVPAILNVMSTVTVDSMQSLNLHSIVSSFTPCAAVKGYVGWWRKGQRSCASTKSRWALPDLESAMTYKERVCARESTFLKSKTLQISMSNCWFLCAFSSNFFFLNWWQGLLKILLKNLFHLTYQGVSACAPALSLVAVSTGYYVTTRHRQAGRTTKCSWRLGIPQKSKMESDGIGSRTGKYSYFCILL